MIAPFRRIAASTALASLAMIALPASALTLLTEENPPFNYTEKGKVTGLSTEIVLDMAKRAGVPATTRLMEWDAAYVAAQADKDTCVYSTARIENRERLFQWVGPIATNRWAVFGKSDFAVPVKSITDLRKLRIGAVAADAKADFLMSKSVTNLRLAGNEKQLPPRLSLAKTDPNYIDLWVTGVYGAKQLAAETKAGDIKMVLVVREQDTYLACSPRTPKDLVKKLSDALEAMNKDGTVKKITDAYEKRFGQ